MFQNSITSVFDLSMLFLRVRIAAICYSLQILIIIKNVEVSYYFYLNTKIN